MTTKDKATVAIVIVARYGWLVYVAVVAIWGAIDLYFKYGVGGFFLGLVLGVLVGAMSATIWALLFYLVFRIGWFIFRLCKPSAEKQL